MHEGKNKKEVVEKEFLQNILDFLSSCYPATGALRYQNPFQLLVAAVLSAQSTDEQVNRITGPLFEKYPDAFSLARLTPEQLMPWIRGCGLYQAKSRHLVEIARILVNSFGGQVPASREELMRLPGVGRKTANVVLSNAFGVPALAVDTHVLRVSKRLGLASGRTAEEVEEQLTALLPSELWGKVHHWLIWHGRKVCRARKPACSECGLVLWCAFYAQQKE